MVLQMIYAAGFRYLRTDLKWQLIEKQAGIYDFSAYDTYVANATTAGLKIVFIFDYANPLYDGGYSPYDQAGYTAFANYAKQGVAHFQGRGIIWEIYNEPTGFWTNPNYPQLLANSDAAIVAPWYSGMALATGSAIKAAYPGEVVIGPALPWVDSKSPSYFNNSMVFLQSVLQSGVGKNLDAISLHPYRTVGPEFAIGDYATVQQAIAASITPNIPIVSSEWGYSSTNYDTGTGTMGYSQAEQLKAERLARSVLINSMQGVKLSILYNWMDSGTDPTNIEDNYGLVLPYSWSSQTPTITALPAYNAIKTLTSQLNGYSYAERVATSDSTDYVVRFTNGTSNVWVCWNSMGTNNTVTIPLGNGVSVTRTNFDGSSVQTVTSGSSGYVCTEGEDPQYLKVN